MPLDGHAYLVSQGWTGKGTGLRQGAISRPVAVAQKKTLSGIGKDRDEAFPFWDHVFSAAADKIKVKIQTNDDSDTDEPTTKTISLQRTSTGIISNKRPVTGTPAWSGVSTPLASTSTSGTSTPRMSVMAAAKQEAARRTLYSMFFRGPIMKSDDIVEKIVQAVEEEVVEEMERAMEAVNELVEDEKKQKRKRRKEKETMEEEVVEIKKSKRKRTQADSSERKESMSAEDKDEKRRLKREKREKLTEVAAEEVGIKVDTFDEVAEKKRLKAERKARKAEKKARREEKRQRKAERKGKDVVLGDNGQDALKQEDEDGSLTPSGDLPTIYPEKLAERPCKKHKKDREDASEDKGKKKKRRKSEILE